MLSEATLKLIIADILEPYNFQVYSLEPLEVSKTPDLEVFGRKDKYTIELKIKGDDPGEIARTNAILSSGQLVSKVTPLTIRNRLYGVISSGVKQLQNHDPNGESYHLLWLHCSGADPEAQSDRYLATLFGSEKLFSNSGEKPTLLTCYYFHDSSFFRWRMSLDGAIVTYVSGSQQLKMIMCVNTLSSRAQQFRDSELPLCLPDTVVDPEGQYGMENNTMIADCDLPRDQTENVLSYLQEKYSVQHLQPFPMKKVETRVRFPFDELDEE